MSVVAHDLSNPLQSLSVLLELTIDDPEIGGDPTHNIHQALQAVDELRVLVREMGDFSQFVQRSSRDQTLAETLDRCISLVARRFQRQNIHVVQNLDKFCHQIVPAGEFDFALLNVLLAVIAGVTKSRCSSYTLTIQCRLTESNVGHSKLPIIEVSIRLHGGDTNNGASSTVAISQHHVSRLVGMLHNIQIRQLDHELEQVLIEFCPKYV